MRLGALQCTSTPVQRLSTRMYIFHGMEEVRGSIPLSSTKNPQVHARGFFAFSGSERPLASTEWATAVRSRPDQARPVAVVDHAFINEGFEFLGLGRRHRGHAVTANAPTGVAASDDSN